MLVWMLTGVAIAAFFVVLVIRRAEADDKKRKLVKRPVSDSY